MTTTTETITRTHHIATRACAIVRAVRAVRARASGQPTDNHDLDELEIDVAERYASDAADMDDDSATLMVARQIGTDVEISESDLQRA